MNNYNLLIEKYSKYIIDNDIDIYEKIENIIKNDNIYTNLDIMEEDSLKNELIKKLKIKNIKNKNKNVNIKEISEIEYNKRVEIFKKLREIVLPEQRSIEWFEMRNNKITAKELDETNFVRYQMKINLQNKFFSNRITEFKT